MSTNPQGQDLSAWDAIGRPKYLVSTLAHAGYRGAAGSLVESLASGVAWNLTDERHVTFVYRMSHGLGFDRKVLSRYADLRDIWPDAPWEKLAKLANTTVNELLAMHSLEDFACAFYQNYGPDKTFGLACWLGFIVLDDTMGGTRASLIKPSVNRPEEISRPNKVGVAPFFKSTRMFIPGGQGKK